MERHLEQYGDWVVSEFGEDGQRSRLITWYVFDPDKFRRDEPGWWDFDHRVSQWHVLPRHHAGRSGFGGGGMGRPRRWQTS
jgi:hypothetical protein